MIDEVVVARVENHGRIYLKEALPIWIGFLNPAELHVGNAFLRLDESCRKDRISLQSLSGRTTLQEVVGRMTRKLERERRVVGLS